jgi:hypothetical protein
MKKYLLILTLGVVLIGQINTSHATVVFSDNFNNEGLDTTKWTPLADTGCSLAVTGGVLRNYFDGYGGSYAKSVNISLPSNWSSVTITGQWAFPVSISGELLMLIKDADALEKWSVVAYDTYNGWLRVQDSSPQTFCIYPRSPSQSLTDFEWTITPTGWQFSEYRNGWSVLANLNTTIFAGMDNMFLQIGGWEYSHYGNLQRTDYDNIVVSVIPEPATICLLGLGALSLIRRKKHA